MDSIWRDDKNVKFGEEAPINSAAADEESMKLRPFLCGATADAKVHGRHRSQTMVAHDIFNHY